MLIVAVKVFPKAELKERFMDRFNRLAVTVRKEDGCLEYELYQKDPETSQCFIYERWESQDALQAHLQSVHMQEYFAETKDWFSSDKQMTTYTVVSG